MKVLVARCDRLGDLVLALPALAWLRQAQPDWEIHALVAPENVPVVEHDPAIDAYYTWNLALDAERLAQIRAERYDAAVLLQYQTPVARLLRNAGVKRRYGPWVRPRSWLLLNRGSWQRRSRVPGHERDFNVDLMRKLAGRDARDVAVALPRVRLGRAQEDLGREFRASEAAGARTVVFVHPGSGGSALDWSPQRFAEVANALSRRAGWRVFITGSHHDRAVIDAMAPALEPQVQVVSERFPLRDFLGVLSAGDLMVAPSTGPLHVAAALDLAVVGVYPPAPTMSPQRWGALGRWAESLVPPVECPARRYCLQEHCLLYNCLDCLAPSRLVEAAVALVERRRRDRAADLDQPEPKDPS
jgi:ADP-heptose:LPS heptosyltransferase